MVAPAAAGGGGGGGGGGDDEDASLARGEPDRDGDSPGVAPLRLAPPRECSRSGLRAATTTTSSAPRRLRRRWQACFSGGDPAGRLALDAVRGGSRPRPAMRRPDGLRRWLRRARAEHCSSCSGHAAGSTRCSKHRAVVGGRGQLWKQQQRQRRRIKKKKRRRRRRRNKEGGEGRSPFHRDAASADRAGRGGRGEGSSTKR